MTQRHDIRRHRWLTVLVYLTILLTATGIAMGQIGGSGSIQGTIKDPSGAVVPQADVTAINVATGVETARQTTAAGFYVISPLPPGEYKVTIAATGFQTVVQEHMIVDALSVVGLNMTLKIGTSTEQVTVSDAPPQLNTDDATLSQTVRNDVYTSLPLAMNSQGPRDPTQFISLVPGVQAVGNQISGTVFASFNGGQNFMNQIYVEGLPLENVVTQGDSRNVSYAISVEAIEQFQVELSSMPAMYQGQGVENFVLKSGTDQFHGVGYEYLRNTVFDARGFFNAYRPVERQNQAGSTFAGPIKKNRVFFFGSYDAYRFTQALIASLQSIPTVDARVGNFSAFGVAIYDPSTTACAGAVCTRQPFAGNAIPASRLSSVSKSFQSYLPTPINSSLQNNYLPSIPITLRNDSTTEKVDVNLSDKNRAYGMYSRGKYNAPLQPITDGYAGPLPYTNTRVVIEVPTTAQAKDVYVIRPNLLNQFSYGYMREWIPLQAATQGGDYDKKAGLTGLPAGQASWAFPQVTFSGPNSPLAWGGGRTLANTDAVMSFTMQDNVQWVHGRHSVTGGFEFVANQDNYEGSAGGSGQTTFAFANTQTAGFSPTGTLLTSTGNAYASYLLGLVNSGNTSETAITRTGARYKDYAWYLQDNFKVSSRLTLTLGLRYDILGPFQEVRDRFSFLNPDLPNPAAGGFHGALQFGGYGTASCHCSAVMDTHHDSIGPRLGLAYRLGDKTVIRAGYAIMYAHMGGVGGRGGAHNGPGTLGYSASPSFSSLDGGISAAFNWDSGFPTYLHPPFFDPTLNTGFTTAVPSGGSISIADTVNGALPPRIQNFNFGVQRALGSNLTFGATYSGSVSHHLAASTGRSIFTDQILPKYLALGNLLRSTATAANIAAAHAILPEITAVPYSNFNGTIAQMLRPFPQYSGVSDTFPMIGNGSYSSLQLTMSKKMAAGLVANVAYSFAKEIDDIGSARTAYNLQLEKAVGTVDQRHVLNATFVYLLPFGKGHHLGDGNAVVRSLVGGWQISGITTTASGAPLGPLAGTCNAPNTGSCYASFNPTFSGPVNINGYWGDGNVFGSSPTTYIAKGAFVDPAAFTFGNTPRTLPFGLRTPRTLNQDMSLRRQFAFRERLKLAIQADFFNLTNRTQFGGIGTNIDSSNFGTVSTQANSPRKIQLAARLSF
jgi:hypothetical protein